MTDIRVGNKREDGNYDLIVDDEVHPTHYVGVFPDEPEEGLTLLGADGDPDVSMQYCMTVAVAVEEFERG